MGGGRVSLTAPNLQAEGGAGVESARELPSQQSWQATGRREPETPRSRRPSCSSHGGSTCCGRDPPALLPGGRQAAIPGQESHPQGQPLFRGSWEGQAARAHCAEQLLPASPWAAAMLKITASLPGGVTPESAVSCPRAGGLVARVKVKRGRMVCSICVHRLSRGPQIWSTGSPGPAPL